MRVEALKVKKGLLIPFSQLTTKIKGDKVLLEVEIVEDTKLEEGYEILEELVGFCTSSRSDASINHDAVIYELESKK